MTFAIVPIDATAAPVAAALHEAGGLTESWDAKSFVSLLSVPGTEGRFALAEATADPVGLVLWRIAADEAEILTISVLPAWRRKGAGRILLESAIAAIRSRGATRIFLEVAVDNAPAERLYRDFGFETAGRRLSYYRTPTGMVDAAILVKHSV